MHIRVGDQVISLEHLIYARRNAPRDGGLRLKLMAGWTVDLSGPEAEATWAALCRIIPESKGQPEGAGGRGIPRRPPQGK